MNEDLLKRAAHWLERYEKLLDPGDTAWLAVSSNRRIGIGTTYQGIVREFGTFDDAVYWLANVREGKPRIPMGIDGDRQS